ncbi:hypothetical protein GCM10029963_24680 [Micromonospora andamanensis]|nr:hypothetical protein Vwe01_16780 [Micromonospora andamanensis]
MGASSSDSLDSRRASQPDGIDGIDGKENAGDPQAGRRQADCRVTPH